MGDETDTEYLKLATEDKCVHKLWKARVSGYEDVIKLFPTLEPKAAEWSKYNGLVKKFVVDGNAVAQEKGLDAVLLYMENSGNAGRVVTDVMAGVISKCIGAPKAKTKDLALQITMMCIEIEKQELVQEELMKGFDHKNPKVVAGCVATTSQALREFGPKVINIKPLIKKIGVLLEDRDKNVRDEGKKLVVDMYRWIGMALKPQLTALKPIQITELESEFEKIGSEKGVQTRFLRSQQELKAKAEVKADDNEGDEDAGDGPCVPEIDPYDLMEPKDILSKLPADFYDKVEAKKWQERKEAVEALEQLLQHPKLANGDYADLVKALKKLVSKDTNVMIVTLAAKCLAAVANGIKKKFSPYAVVCVSVILDKFKEKKQNVVLALRDAIDAIYPSSNFEALQEDILAGLDNKNPSVKAETASFLARCFSKCTPTVLNKKVLKIFMPPLLKTLNEPDPSVRDASADAIGVSLKVVGDKGMVPYLAEVDALKMAKIKESCEKAVITAKRAPGVKKVVKSEEPLPVKSSSAPALTRKAPVAVQTKKPSAPKKNMPAKAKAPSPVVKNEEVMEKDLTPEEVDEQAEQLLPAELLSGLSDVNWKNRLIAVEQFIQLCNSLDKSSFPCQVLIRTLLKKPGLKENNFQVLKLRLEAVKLLAEGPNFRKQSAEYTLPDVVDKLGDPKNNVTASDALVAMAEALRLDYISQEVLQLAFAQKNPKVQAESMLWLSNTIKEFGFVVHQKPVIETIKKALAATNPAVRGAGVTLLGTMSLYMGQPNLRILFENEKAALLQQIDTELEKHVGKTPPAPTKGLSPTTEEAPGGGIGNEEEEEEMSQNSEKDIVTRVDISEEITEALLIEMTDKNWKVRNEALQRIITILNEAKFVKQSLGELPTALNLRLTDSNKNIAATALQICQQLGKCLGSNCKHHVRSVLPGMLVALGDIKPLIRTNAVTCMNVWAEKSGVQEFFQCEIIADALKVGTPYLKTDLFIWLSEKLPDVKGLPKDELLACLPMLFSSIEDRNVDVRKSAQDALLPFMIHLGYESMTRATQKLKPSSMTPIIALLDKARPNLPAKPAPKPKTAPAAQPSKINTATMTKPKADRPATASKPAASKTKLGAPPVRGGVRGKEDEIDTNPLIQENNLKKTRFLDEQKLRVLKWNFPTPRDEFLELLKEQMTTSFFNRNLVFNMFHTDFKFHLRALDSLIEDLPSNPQAVVCNLDLILKWLTLRFFDTNPSVLLKSLDYLKSVFGMLEEERYHMHDIEANSFVPYLLTKVGDPKDVVRFKVHSLLKVMCSIYPTSKLFSMIMEGLKSKNARQRAECLEELGELISNFTLLVCQPNPPAALKEIAKQISDRDNNVRNAALNAVVEAYFLAGERIYRMIGQISDKDQSLLDERIKRATKNRGPVIIRPTTAPVVATKAPLNKVIRTGNSLHHQLEQQLSDPEDDNLSEENDNLCLEEDVVTSPTEGDIHIDTGADERENSLGRYSNSPPRPQTTSGYQLRYFKCDELDKQYYDSPISQVKLIDIDYNAIVNDNPIRLPIIKSRLPSSYLSELMISQVASFEPNTAVNAVSQIESAIKGDDGTTYLLDHIDQLLVVFTMQYRHLNDKKNIDTVGRNDAVRIYKTFGSALMAFFTRPVLAQHASQQVVHDLVDVLLQVLLDDRLVDGNQENKDIIRLYNVVIVRMIEHVDHTTMTSTVIKLLHEAVGRVDASTRYVELVMKCLWKITRVLPDWLSEINIDQILLDIHIFLKAYPSHSWKGKSEDTPMRTIRTILHTLVRLKGNKIMSHFTLVHHPKESEMETYVLRVLKNGEKGERENKDDQENEKGGYNYSKTSSRRMSKTLQDQLTSIFQKIGSRDKNKEGLAQLYEFREKHPEADLEPFLKRSSQFFQQYIDRELNNIDAERKKTIDTNNINGNKEHLQRNVLGILPPLNPGEHTAADMMERLRTLRVMAGMESSNTTASNSPKGSPIKQREDNSDPLLDSPPRTFRLVDEEVEQVIETVSPNKIREIAARQELELPHSHSTEAVSTISSSDVAALRRRLEIVKNSSAM